MARATAEQLAKLQHQPQRIRNLCVLAHVDHGKTTLSDSLVSSNGLISTKSVGKVRYMDYLPEEQERGITMKSSSISLYYKHGTESVPYLINLIDSPGHVDFSFEVSTAVRLTDGALVVVDVVEGVCIQTETVLRQAYADRVRPLLVLNKIDRLFNERHLSADEAYYHLRKVLEQVNGVAGELWKETQLRATLARDEQLAPSTSDGANEVQLEGTSPDEAEEIYFSPTAGNVIFASAYDSWGFRTSHFAEMYAKKLNIRPELLLKTLWGEFYFSAKAKRIYTRPSQNDVAPMFVQFCLKNLWDVYQAVMVDKNSERIEKICKALNLKLPARDMTMALRDPRTVLSSLMGQWLPLSEAVLSAAVQHLPSPLEAAAYRVPVVTRPLPGGASQELVAAHKTVHASLMACNPTGPVVVFVSKVFSVPRDQIVQPRRTFVVRPRPARDASAPAAAAANANANATADERVASPPIAEKEKERVAPPPIAEANKDAPDEVFVGLARVYSGTLKRGQRVHVLGPRYSPDRPDEYRTEMDASELYLLMGRALEPIDEVPAGNVFGISGAGVEHLILKTATLAETPSCTTFSVLRMSAAPIVRVAVEPRNVLERARLAEGLRRLEHSDPLCTVDVLDSGEHIVAAAGELHLERCLKDLRERFARIELVVSPPLFSFRETITEAPRRTANAPSPSVEQHTANRLISMTVRAVPLGSELTRFLDAHMDLIRRVCADELAGADEPCSPEAVEAFKRELLRLLSEAGLAALAPWLWAFGPRRCGPNLLFCPAAPLAALVRLTGASARLAIPLPADTAPAAASSDEPPKDAEQEEAQLRELASSFVAGFQVAASAGPLCEEPLSGVAFVLEAVGVHREAYIENEAHGQGLTGQVISAAKEACRHAFLRHSPRLVEPFFLCDIQCHADALGKLYSVLGRRRAKIFKEEPKEGTHLFTVQAHLPVSESIGFGDELLKKTSGSAYPQLLFSHWDVLDQDPYWMPTEEELETHGDNAASVGLNVARKLMDDVRRRKGLYVEEKIVEHAEKQRTLKKNK